MKLNEVLNLNEETVRKCLKFFQTIYNTPRDLEQAANRKEFHETEKDMYKKPYYEDSNKNQFFSDLTKTIQQISQKDKTIGAKFAAYTTEYKKHAPEDGYICGTDEDIRATNKFNQTQRERETLRNQTTKVFRPKYGKNTDDPIY